MAEYRKATLQELKQLWDKNIAENTDDPRWKRWKKEYISYNKTGKGCTFTVVIDGEPVGEATLLFSPKCGAVGGRKRLADGKTTANINALRISKAHEGHGHISALVRIMESYAAEHGITRLTIGSEQKNTRNTAIYHHWGYNELVAHAFENEEVVLYYAKDL